MQKIEDFIKPIPKLHIQSIAINISYLFYFSRTDISHQTFLW